MFRLRYLMIVTTLISLVLTLFPVPNRTGLFATDNAIYSTPPEPRVAIHVSELTQNLETMPAQSPTPVGPGTTGYQWWTTAWHYFVGYESLKEALRSDGTPFVEVSDADIMAGGLLHADGSPKYPILFSLASEAIHDDELSPLRDYVAAGGFLFVGSSSFTRYPDGRTRRDFALAEEMGLHMSTTSLNNWSQNSILSKIVDHRLVKDIPWGSLRWRMPLTSEQIPLGTSPAHIYHENQYIWRVWGSGAEVIANWASGPGIAVKDYGQGRFIYHGAFQPLLGHGGLDSGMYAYTIIKNAIEWAFETNQLPVVRLSPWRYPHDAAFLVRHDFENDPASIQAIEATAQFEQSIGVKGDYYFCTGVLRPGSADTQLNEQQKAQAVESLRRAVSLYGATIGSHNGGLSNPVNLSLQPGQYDYWHWGPDEALDVTPPGYPNGAEYARSSISISFQDVEGWLAGLDNGRPGCGAAGNCPRTWVSPYFNSTREASYGLLENLGSITMGEQKISPFPHWTLSTQIPGKRFDHLTLPVSDWYVGNTVAQSLESKHTLSTIRDLIDAYFQLGALINLYSHSTSTNALYREYVTYSLSKPGIWSTNAVEVYDWWMQRSSVVVHPTFSVLGDNAVTQISVSEATDAETSIDVLLPGWGGDPTGQISVLLDGMPASQDAYRYTDFGLKIKVGNTVSNVTVQYPLANSWEQIDWSGGDGQAIWSDPTRYEHANGIDTSAAGRVSLGVASTGSTLYQDDFTRSTSPPPLSPWVVANGAWAIESEELRGTGASSSYANAYVSNTWGNYSVQARLQLPAGAHGGGIGGRVSSTDGSHYAAWIYPQGSSGGSNVLKLIKFRRWNVWNNAPMAVVNIPDVGTAWHTLEMTFIGNRILVYYDSELKIDVFDNTFDRLPPFLSGGVSVDTWTPPGYGGAYSIAVDDLIVRNADTYILSGSLLSSAFDGGAGVQWGTISWDAWVLGSTSVQVRTRTAAQPGDLASAPWSDWVTSSGSPIASPDQPWIQYELQLSTANPSIFPVVDHVHFTYFLGNSPLVTPTATGTLSSSATLTNTANPTETATQTQTPTPTGTSTLTSTPANSPTPTSTSTPTDTPASSPTPTATQTPTQTPTGTQTPPQDLIFADGFEAGDLSAWSSSSIDGGDLSASPSAALAGSSGLQALLDDNGPIYVLDDLPDRETHYQASFLFDPNSITMANNDNHLIFHAYSNSAPTLQLRLQFVNGQYRLRGEVDNDNRRWAFTGWVVLTDAVHSIQIEWRAATAAGANNGEFSLWVDGIQLYLVSGIDNDSRGIDQARLGAVGEIDSGTRGTVYFDTFESYR